MPQAKELTRHLVLSDWAAGIENFPSDPFAIATEVLLHGLLYERVFVQDEAIVLSRKLARAFATGDVEANRRILCQVLDSNAVRILTIASWPPDLEPLVRTRPIYARALYVTRFGARVGSREFVPSAEQWKFYDLFDSVLRNRRRLLRRPPTASNLVPLFHATTKEILGSAHYNPWIHATAGTIPQRMREDFVTFIENPQEAVRRLRNAKLIPRVVGSRDRKVEFMRALAYQLGALYPRNYARAMERVIQSTFNAAFCDTHAAAGRFGKGLAEVVIHDDVDTEDKERPVNVEHVIRTSVPLPGYFDDFGAAVAAVRELPSVNVLRQVTNDPWSNERATSDAWAAVAHDLARRVSRGRSQNMVTAVVAFGKDFAKGVVADGGAQWAADGPVNWKQVLAKAGLSGLVQGVYQCGSILPRMNRYRKGQAAVRQILLGAFQTRCSRVEVAKLTSQSRLEFEWSTPRARRQ